MQLQYFQFNCLIDKESKDGRQPRRSRKRDLLKRVMSSSHRANTIEVSDTDSPVRDVKSIVSEFSIRKRYNKHFIFWFMYVVCWM